MRARTVAMPYAVSLVDHIARRVLLTARQREMGESRARAEVWNGAGGVPGGAGSWRGSVGGHALFALRAALLAFFVDPDRESIAG